MKLIAKSKRDQNEAWVDPWTLVHFGAGLAFALAGRPKWPSMAAAAAFEVVEQLSEKKPESLGNAAVDLAVFYAGFVAGEKFNASE